VHVVHTTRLELAPPSAIGRPNIFYAKVVPAAPEMLERLLHEQPMNSSWIFGEVIRQSHTECAIINNCRDFFTNGMGNVPHIEKHYPGLLESIQKQIAERRCAIETLGPVIERAGYKKAFLATLMADLRKELKIPVDYHDGVIRNGVIAGNELNGNNAKLIRLPMRIQKKGKADAHHQSTPHHDRYFPIAHN
jgi:hypothetical protein